MKFIKWVTTIMFVLSLVLVGCSPQATPAPAAPAAPAPTEAEPTQPPAEPAAPAAPAPTEVQPTVPAGPQVGGNFIWVQDQEPDTLDWHKSALQSSYNVFTYVGAGLVGLTADQKLVPWLAESYKVSDDGLNYDFTLRKDVKFHDGSPLTAKDYVWTFNRALDPKTASPVAGQLLGPVSSITVIDEYTFRITLTSAFAPLLFNLSDPGYTQPMSEAAFTKMGEEAYGRAPVGVGPYKVKSWKTGESIVLERNPDYIWGTSASKNSGPAYLQTIEFRTISEYSTTVAGLQAGEIQFAKIQPKDVESIQSSGKYGIISQPSKGMTPFLVLNVSKPPFDDVKVRQAFNYAINRQGLIDVVLLGKGEKQLGPLSPTQIGYWDGAAKIGYDYDLAKAKQLIADAGFTTNSSNMLQKDGKPLSLAAMVFAGNERNTKTIQVVQQQMKDLGVDMTIDQVDPGQAFKRLMEGDYTISILGISAPEADFLYGLFHSKGGLNIGHISDPDMDILLDKSRSTVDPAQRQLVLNDIQKMVIEKAYVVPLFVPQDFYALDSNVLDSPLLFFDTLDLISANLKTIK